MAKTIEELMAKAGGYKLSDEEETLETPETPETPEGEQPEAPETPEEEENLEASEAEDEPEKPETPEAPETPETPEGTAGKEIPKAAETPETPETPEVPEQPESKFANEQVAKLNEYVSQGGSFEDFARTQTVDYGKMDHVSLIIEETALSDPELTREEVELLVNETYGVSKGASDTERKLALIRLKKDGEKARREMLKHQEKWRVPVQPGMSQEQKQAQLEAWKSTLKSTADKIESLDIVLNDKDTFKFKVEGDAREKVKTAHEDVSKFFNRYMKPDGSEDTEKFVKEMFILDNYESIIRAAAAFNKTKGKEEIVDEIKNPDFKGKGKKGNDDGNLSIVAQAARAVLG